MSGGQQIPNEIGANDILGIFKTISNDGILNFICDETNKCAAKCIETAKNAYLLKKKKNKQNGELGSSLP